LLNKIRRSRCTEESLPSTGFRDDRLRNLTWESPDNVGSAIAAYDMIGRGSSGAEIPRWTETKRKSDELQRSALSIRWVTHTTYRITAVHGDRRKARPRNPRLPSE